MGALLGTADDRRKRKLLLEKQRKASSLRKAGKASTSTDEGTEVDGELSDDTIVPTVQALLYAKEQAEKRRKGAPESDPPLPPVNTGNWTPTWGKPDGNDAMLPPPPPAESDAWKGGVSTVVGKHNGDDGRVQAEPIYDNRTSKEEGTQQDGNSSLEQDGAKNGYAEPDTGGTTGVDVFMEKRPQVLRISEEYQPLDMIAVIDALDGKIGKDVFNYLRAVALEGNSPELFIQNVASQFLGDIQPTNVLSSISSSIIMCSCRDKLVEKIKGNFGWASSMAGRLLQMRRGLGLDTYANPYGFVGNGKDGPGEGYGLLYIFNSEYKVRDRYDNTMVAFVRMVDRGSSEPIKRKTEAVKKVGEGEFTRDLEDLVADTGAVASIIIITNAVKPQTVLEDTFGSELVVNADLDRKVMGVAVINTDGVQGSPEHGGGTAAIWGKSERGTMGKGPRECLESIATYNVVKMVVELHLRILPDKVCETFYSTERHYDTDGARASGGKAMYGRKNGLPNIDGVVEAAAKMEMDDEVTVTVSVREIHGYYDGLNGNGSVVSQRRR